MKELVGDSRESEARGGLLGRRQLLTRAATAIGGASVGLVAGGGVGCQSSSSTQPSSSSPLRVPLSAPLVLANGLMLVLEDLVDEILPGSDLAPGARELGIAAFVERFVVDVLPEADRDRWTAQLAELAAQAEQRHGKPFYQCAPEQKRQVVADLRQQASSLAPEQRAVSFFARLHALTLRGYCTSQAVATQLLRYDPIPGRFEACIPLSSVEGRAWATH